MADLPAAATPACEVFGIAAEDLKAIPRIAHAGGGLGRHRRFRRGHRHRLGRRARAGRGRGRPGPLISPDGVKTPFGTTPRVNAYEVVYIFTAGRYDIDRTRVYMPFAEAQSYFNREGVADEIEVMVADPEQVERHGPAADWRPAATGALLWTWRDAAGGFLRALEVEDNVMFVILSILVLIAAMNIVSGLIMLVKNKGRDIGILRTMGLTEGSVLRVFFICGAFTGHHRHGARGDARLPLRDLHRPDLLLRELRRRAAGSGTRRSAGSTRCRRSWSWPTCSRRWRCRWGCPSSSPSSRPAARRG